MTYEKKEMLLKMGFRKNARGVFNHCLLDGDFDIAGTPIENIVYEVYMKAHQVGMELMQEKIRNIIGIK